MDTWLPGTTKRSRIVSNSDLNVDRPLIEMQDIVKRFPGVTAADSAHLEIKPGEVHALLGENGAGKTTLVNILSGLYQPDAGVIRVDGVAQQFRSPRDALQAGIGIVHQHFCLVDVFSVSENIMIGLQPFGLKLDLQTIETQITEMGKQYGLGVDPNAKIWQLSVGEQQRVEILKMLYRNVKLLILDEPTAVLTPQEADELSKTLRKMAASGQAVLYISHKLSEVLGVADRITILRSGSNVTTVNASDVDERQLTKLLIGEDVPIVVKAGEDCSSNTALAVKDLKVVGDRDYEAVRGLDLDVRCGEILGLAGVAGNGQKELAEAIVGLRPVSAGTISLNGEDVTHQTPGKLIDAGLSLVPEDRMGTGLVPTLDIYENAILKNYKTPSFSRGPLLNWPKIQQYAEGLVNDYSVKVTRLSEPVWKLSGGNLQRLLLGREISSEPSVLIAANPIRGLDIQAAHEIHQILLEQKSRGAAILVISEDVSELLSIADRIAVIYDGQIIGEVHSADAEIDEIGLMMAGTRMGGK
jgi:general nucleoside transport system ATP-binding protein